MTNNDFEHAIALSNSGNKNAAREILKEILENDTQNEMAWMWYADTFTESQGRIQAFRECLENIPNSQYAKKMLARFNTDEIDTGKVIQRQESRVKNAQEVHAQTQVKSKTSSEALQRSSAKQDSKRTPLLILVGVFGIIFCLVFLIGIWVFASQGAINFPPIISTPTVEHQEIDDATIKSQIQVFYNNLTLKGDMTSFGMGIVDFPAKNYFSILGATVIDQSINDKQATVIVRVKYLLNEKPTGGIEEILIDYFGLVDGVFYDPPQPFEQERKFIFQLYESGVWRVEVEVMTK
jgi:hypothetical protein